MSLEEKYQRAIEALKEIAHGVFFIDVKKKARNTLIALGEIKEAEG